MFKGIDPREARTVGRQLAELFHAHASSELIEYLSATKSPAYNQTIQRLMHAAVTQTRSLKLNIIKRTALLSAFRIALVQKELNEQAIDVLMRLLDQAIHVGQQMKAPSALPAEVKSKRVEITVETFKEIQQLISLRKYREAAEILKELVRLEPTNAAFTANYGAVLIDVGDVQAGRRALERAIELNPNLAAPYINLSSLSLWQGNFESAEKAARRAIKLEPANPKPLSLLGSTLLHKGDIRRADHTLRLALKVEPHNDTVLSSLAAVCSAKGDKQAAETFYKRALEANAYCADALAGLMALNVSPAQNDALAQKIRGLLNTDIALSVQTTLRYSLGTYFDRVRQYEDAFSNFKQANELKKQFVTPYDPVQHTEFTNHIIRSNPTSLFEHRLPKASESNVPVFVVGMMRSGTSLVEQIIASHPAAFGAGELDYWHHLVIDDPSLLQEPLVDKRKIKKITENYLHILRKHSSNAKRIVDKATFNLAYLGLIHRIFPGAKFIYLKRNPIDTCLSCYFQNFVNGAAFALDLEHLAHYYKEQLKLIRHWKAVLPSECLLEVPYERLVESQEAWSQKIISFIGLPWKEEVLQFHKTERTIQTASLWQVREKMHNKSIGRWEPYQRWITPLLALQEFTDI